MTDDRSRPLGGHHQMSGADVPAPPNLAGQSQGRLEICTAPGQGSATRLVFAAISG